jgi:DNA polymerase I-like protein with 3'-5' exonuclease and polymerase domains
MITIAQLQAAYKAINGVEAGDVHRLRASYMFGVPYLDITEEQRQIGEAANIQEQFGGSICKSNLDKIICSTPITDAISLAYRKVRRYKHVTDWSFRPSV